MKKTKRRKSLSFNKWPIYQMLREKIDKMPVIKNPWKVLPIKEKGTSVLL
jgi:hypothetical protein